jgi:hypothetical protein
MPDTISAGKEHQPFSPEISGPAVGFGGSLPLATSGSSPPAALSPITSASLSPVLPDTISAGKEHQPFSPEISGPAVGFGGSPPALYSPITSASLSPVLPDTISAGKEQQPFSSEISGPAVGFGGSPPELYSPITSAIMSPASTGVMQPCPNEKNDTMHTPKVPQVSGRLSIFGEMEPPSPVASLYCNLPSPVDDSPDPIRIVNLKNTTTLPAQKLDAASSDLSYQAPDEINVVECDVRFSHRLIRALSHCGKL